MRTDREGLKECQICRRLTESLREIGIDYDMRMRDE